MRASREVIIAMLTVLNFCGGITQKNYFKVADHVLQLLQLNDGLEDQRVQLFLGGVNNNRVPGFMFTTALLASNNQPRTEEKAFCFVLVLSKLLHTNNSARVFAQQTFQFFGQYMNQLAYQLLHLCRDEAEFQAFYDVYGREAQ